MWVKFRFALLQCIIWWPAFCSPKVVLLENKILLSDMILIYLNPDPILTLSYSYPFSTPDPDPNSNPNPYPNPNPDLKANLYSAGLANIFLIQIREW